jgi:AraC-like DNA-binding protein
MSLESAHYTHASDIGGLEYLKASFRHQNFSRHIHEGFCVGVIEEGAQGFYRSGANHVASRDSIILVNADEVHDGHSITENGWSYKAIYPMPEQLGEVGCEMGGLSRGIPYFTDPVVDDPELAFMLRQFFNVLDQSDNQLERQSWFVTTMSALIFRHGKSASSLLDTKRSPQKIEMIKEYLNDNFQKNVSLNELSDLVQLNPQYLVRLFRKHVGMPPHAYQVQSRIHKAKILIRNGASLSDAAVDSGFSDQSHMNLYFKRFYGTSPGKFKEPLINSG